MGVWEMSSSKQWSTPQFHGSNHMPFHRFKLSITGELKGRNNKGGKQGQENQKSEKLRELPLWGAFEVCFCLKLSERQKEKS